MLAQDLATGPAKQTMHMHVVRHTGMAQVGRSVSLV